MEKKKYEQAKIEVVMFTEDIQTIETSSVVNSNDIYRDKKLKSFFFDDED